MDFDSHEKRSLDVLMVREEFPVTIQQTIALRNCQGIGGLS
jgi:hypothetical protein